LFSDADRIFGSSAKAPLLPLECGAPSGGHGPGGFPSTIAERRCGGGARSFGIWGAPRSLRSVLDPLAKKIEKIRPATPKAYWVGHKSGVPALSNGARRPRGPARKKENRALGFRLRLGIAGASFFAAASVSRRRATPTGRGSAASLRHCS